MSNFSLSELPPVFVSNTEISKAVSDALDRGELRKIGTRLYTKNLSDDPARLVRSNWHYLLKEYYPDAIVTDRTGLENKPAEDGSVFIISEKSRDTELPGITFKPRPGPPALDTDTNFIGGIKLASQARAYLENMRPSRARSGVARTLSKEELEQRLDAIIRTSGEAAVNNIRDDARAIAPMLGLEEEFKELDGLIGHLLRTRDGEAESEVGQARQAGKPYDPNRIPLFESLFVELKDTPSPQRRISEPTSDKNANLSFFEAYFSNFIEGTDFEVDEAYEIVFDGVIPAGRPEDAHDVLGTYRVVSDRVGMARIPDDFDSFIDVLCRRHAAFMELRPSELPGEFKQKPNRAGSTSFVAPDLVRGTLEKGYEFYTALEEPLHRAIFMMFLVSEVHPFKDGNGRAARIMMNADLVAGQEQKIIIPIVYRDNYLSALKAISQTQNPRPVVRMLSFAQEYTAAIDWSDFDRARAMLAETHAFLESGEAEDRGVRLMLPS